MYYNNDTINNYITMATIKSYTDIEQSRKLAEILPLKSADMCYPLPYEDGDKPLLEQGGFGSTPCWSLAALLSVLPKYEIYNNNGEIIQLDVNLEALSTEANETLLDLVVNMIIYLHELNLL